MNTASIAAIEPSTILNASSRQYECGKWKKLLTGVPSVQAKSTSLPQWSMKPPARTSPFSSSTSGKRRARSRSSYLYCPFPNYPIAALDPQVDMV